MRNTNKSNFTVVVAICGICALVGSALALPPTFTATVNSVIGSDTRAPIFPRAGGLAVADFNGDGLADVALAGTSVGGVAVFLNNGTGGAAQTWFPAGRWPVALAPADFDGDGDIDLACANRNEGGVAILANDGAGRFTRAAFYATGTTPDAVVAFDMDKDGSIDLVVANRTGSTVVVLGNTGGALSVRQSVPLPNAVPNASNVSCQPCSLAVADMNADAWPDVVVACAADDTARILTSTGGTLALTHTLPAGPYPVSVSAADFDRDSRMDLVVADADGVQLTLLRADSLGGYQPQEISLVAPPYATPVLQDVLAVNIDGDFDVDLIAAGLIYTNKNGVFSIRGPSTLPYDAYARGQVAGDSGVFAAGVQAGTVQLTYFVAGPPSSTSTQADITHDGAVNVFDLQILARSWNKSAGQQGFDPRADLDGNGTVNVFDLMILAASFGQRVN